MTGDPSWIRERPLPRLPSSTEFQCGLTDGRAGRHPPTRAAGHRRVPGRAGASRAALPDELLLRDDVVPRRASRLEAGIVADDVRGHAVRRGRQPRAITWGDEVAGDGEGGVAGGRDRLRRVGHPRRHPPRPGGPAVHHRRQERRARAAPGGRTAIPAPGSTSAATSTATRSSPATTGASTTASSPSCATTSPTVVDEVRAAARTAGSAPRSPRSRGTRRARAWRVDVRGPDGADRGHRRAVRRSARSVR